MDIHAYHCQGDFGAQPLHCHEEVEFIEVYQGQGVFQCGRARHATGPSLLSVAGAQEPHGGTPRTDDFAVNVLNVSCRWFEAMELDWRLLWRKDAVCEPPAALDAFRLAYEAVRHGSSLLDQDEALLALCHAAGEPQSQTTGRERRPTEQAVLFLRERFAEQVSLPELAMVAGLTPSYFCRAFKKTIGVSPHSYQNSLRVARAKTLLEQGDSAGDVAHAVGFYDQSHLTMHMTRLLGMTPGMIARKAFSSYLLPSERE